jgi:CrcB protein
MKNLLFIALGGSFGAVARYVFSKFVYRFSADVFPWGTLAVNMSGSFFIGFFFGLFDELIVPTHIKSFITIGFLGAYTTFSTYSLESLNLFRDGEIRLFAANILLSNICCILFALLGMYFAKTVISFIK